MRTIEVLYRKDETFFKKLKPVDRGHVTMCWEFTGHKYSNGYGRLGTPMQVGKELCTRSHRYAYILLNGPIPRNKILLHHCDNKLCCRPEHLYKGTHKQNMKDYKERGSYKHTGSRSAISVFEETDIQIIRWLNELHFSLDQLANMYGKNKSSIDHILHRRTWKDVSNRDFNKKSFLQYLKQRKSKLKLPGVKQLNWRSSHDLAMIKGFVDVNTQQGVATMFNVSRNSIRNACDRADFIMTPDKADRQMKDYLRWKKKYNTILSLIEKYGHYK